MSDQIGIFGGTFDPLHTGHLAVAEDTRTALGLRQMLFIPAGEQPLKRHREIAPAHHRLEMVRLACADNPRFAVSDMEMSRSGSSYTVDTLEELRDHGIVEPFLILGADALADLPRWRNINRVLELATIVAVGRPQAAPDLHALAQTLPQLQQRLVQLDGPNLAISSTEIRRRVADGRSIRYLVPEPVADYIAAHSLYRS